MNVVQCSLHDEEFFSRVSVAVLSSIFQRYVSFCDNMMHKQYDNGRVSRKIMLFTLPLLCHSNLYESYDYLRTGITR